MAGMAVDSRAARPSCISGKSSSKRAAVSKRSASMSTLAVAETETQPLGDGQVTPVEVAQRCSALCCSQHLHGRGVVPTAARADRVDFPQHAFASAQELQTTHQCDAGAPEAAHREHARSPGGKDGQESTGLELRDDLRPQSLRTEPAAQSGAQGRMPRRQQHRQPGH